MPASNKTDLLLSPFTLAGGTSVFTWRNLSHALTLLRLWLCQISDFFLPETLRLQRMYLGTWSFQTLLAASKDIRLEDTTYSLICACYDQISAFFLKKCYSNYSDCHPFQIIAYISADVPWKNSLVKFFLFSPTSERWSYFSGDKLLFDSKKLQDQSHRLLCASSIRWRQGLLILKRHQHKSFASVFVGHYLNKLLDTPVYLLLD